MSQIKIRRPDVLFILIVMLILVGACVMKYERDANAARHRPPEYRLGNNFYRLETTEYGTNYVQYLIPDDLGNGVYRFTIVGDYNLWQRSLRKFKGDHPELVITGTSIGWYNGGLSSDIQSFLVITYPAPGRN